MAELKEVSIWIQVGSSIQVPGRGAPIHVLGRGALRCAEQSAKLARRHCRLEASSSMSTALTTLWESQTEGKWQEALQALPCNLRLPKKPGLADLDRYE